jgi:hypothetical protein
LTQSYAHDAVLRMEPDADVGAPGAAVTTALCGHWQHEPPCPLAPHHTQVHRTGGELTLRLLFAADARDEARVRTLVEDVLSRGWADSPDGSRTTWDVVASNPSPVLAEELAHAERLTRS